MSRWEWRKKEPKVFSVYPNPSNGWFTVEASENENISAWSVYNLAGQKVAQGNAQSGGQSLEINLNLPSGLYALGTGAKRWQKGES